MRRRSARRRPSHQATPETARGAAAGFADSLAVGIGFTREEADPAFLMARLYFGGAPMGETLEPVKPWEQGEAPNVETLTVSVDPEVTTGALAPDPTPTERPSATVGVSGGETIASKGEVTGEGRRPMSPAERLGLNASTRAKQEKCLAEGIYFEARGEPVSRPDCRGAGDPQPRVLGPLSVDACAASSTRTRTAISPASSPSPATAIPT